MAIFESEVNYASSGQSANAAVGWKSQKMGLLNRIPAFAHVRIGPGLNRTCRQTD